MNQKKTEEFLRAIQGMPLPLAEELGARPCVQCGFCCKQCSCGFGSWDYEKKQCKELIENDNGTYNCGAFHAITSLPRERWFVAPAFGAGCCASINTDRERILRKRKATS